MPSAIAGLAGALAALWLAAAALYASFGAAAALLPRAGLALRWTAAAAIAAWIGTVGFHLLLTLGQFNLVAALALTGALAGAVWAALRGRGGVVAPLLADVATLGAALRPQRSRRWVSAAVAAAGLAIVAVVAIVAFAARAASVPVLSWDSLTYHAVKAGLWVQGGGPIELTAPGGWSIYRTYLGGGEALLAWAMLPFHADTLAGLADAAIWLALGLASWALAGEAGLPRHARFAIAVYVMALPAVARTVGSLYIDNTQAFLLVAALAFVLHAEKGTDLFSAAENKSVPFSAALAVATLGTAAGVKIFAAPVAALLTVGLVALLLVRARSLASFAWIAGGTAAAALAVGPWLLRTWQLTGRPLSPLPIQVGPLVLGEPNAALRWYMQRPRLDGAGFAEEIAALGKMLGWPGTVEPIEPVLGIFVLVPVVLAPVALVLLARRRPAAAAAFAAFTVPLLLSFYGDGLRNTRLIWAAVSGRYLIAAIAAIVVLAATMLRGRALTAYAAFLGVASVWHLVVNDIHAWNARDFAFAAGAATISIGLMAAARLPLLTGLRVALTALLAVVLLAGLHGYRERDFARALDETTVLHALPRYWTPAVLELRGDTEPRTLAVTAGPWQDADNWLLYHFLGRRLQNRLVWIPPVAGRASFDMERYGDEVQGADLRAWRQALDARGVTDVVSFAPQSLELAWMEQQPERFRRRAGDGRTWGLYSVLEGK